MRTNNRLKSDNSPREKKASLVENPTDEIPEAQDHGKVTVKICNLPPTWVLMSEEKSIEYYKNHPKLTENVEHNLQVQ